ncbi:GNAT family N-acetyltransferase [Ideonella livida]|uniref:GNAT family N-acetyltransferase n=1 Tax=Ideonella livida TaxID=2707176 RepID=A0A7C9TIW1_9BURK|nr:GNAT family N-acetyltransferase [Ideonella livida]NDY90523.1 GNAT family N-acetyltransferase [Ideonella livida]
MSLNPLPTPQDYAHREALRVRWAEVDAQHIVFNGHYLMYADTAVGGWWRAMAVPYAQAMEALQGDLFVRHSQLDYHQAAELDDLLELGVRCLRLGRSAMTVEVGIFRDGVLLVRVELVYVFAHATERRPLPLPGALRALLEGPSTAPPWVACPQTWEQVAAPVRALRRAAFVQEQGLPQALEEDSLDPSAYHVVLRNRLDQVVAAGRLCPGEASGLGVLARLVVVRPLRRTGLGAALLTALLQQARQLGLSRVELVASPAAAPLYARQGFRHAGPVFDALGRPHQPMVLELVPAGLTAAASGQS